MKICKLNYPFLTKSTSDICLVTELTTLVMAKCKNYRNFLLFHKIEGNPVINHCDVYIRSKYIHDRLV